MTDSAQKGEDREVVVIGGGPAGYVAALRASQLGARVTLVEREALGGTCLNRGCIPTKALLRAVELLKLSDKARQYGIDLSRGGIDFAQMMRRKDAIVRTLRTGVESLIKANRIELVSGTGSLASAAAVRVKYEGGGEEVLSAERIILAPGSLPQKPAIEGENSPGVITSDEALQLSEIPESLVILGAGTAGVEFATIFARLGTKMTLVEMLPQVLPGEDAELALALEGILKREGVRVLTSTQAEGIEAQPDGLKSITLKGQRGESKVEAQLVLVAVGRKPRTEGMGLEKAGVAVPEGAIQVNERMETSIPGIYAAGDATGGIFLAHVAFAEGTVAAENALGGDTRIDYRVVPRCIYTLPEIAAVGLTEREAREKGIAVRVGTFPLAASGKALILGERGGWVKVIAEGRSGELLGVHILAPQATELIAEAALAMKMRATLQDLSSTPHAHPTLYEAIREAALEAEGRPLHAPPKAKGRGGVHEKGLL